MEEKKKGFGFDFLGLISGASMIAAMFFPWWYFRMDMNFVPTIVYPYLIDGPMSQFVGYKRSPTMTILTVVLIVCILLILVGSFMKGKTGRIFLAFIRSHYFTGCLAIDGSHRWSCRPL